MSDQPLRLGTRGSPLGLAKAAWVAEELRAVTDRPVQAGPVTDSPVRAALLAGDIDVAVHSYKDVPTAPVPGLTVAAVPYREDPRDVLVARDNLTLGELPVGSRVGTGAARRIAQLRALGLGLELVPVRGNVEIRLAAVADGSYDAVVLARAGLARLARLEAATETLDPLQVLPAPAQAALAVECRADDTELVRLLATLDHQESRAAVTAERALFATLGAHRPAPVAALADVVEGEAGPELFLRASVTAIDGTDAVRLSATGPVHDAEGVGQRLARDLLADGAAELMGSTR